MDRAQELTCGSVRRVPEGLPKVLSVLWTPGHVLLLRFVARAGFAGARELQREFPDVNVSALYRVARLLAEVGWLEVVCDEPYRVAVHPSAAVALELLLAARCPAGVGAAEAWVPGLFQEELEVLAGLTPSLGPWLSGVSQARLLVSDLRGLA